MENSYWEISRESIIILFSGENPNDGFNQNQSWKIYITFPVKNVLHYGSETL